jgi:DNA-directed RNA polymerase subunit L
VQEDCGGHGHAAPQELHPHQYSCSHPAKKKDRYLFRVETIGQLSPLAVVKKAMAVLREKLKEIEESIN